MTGIVITQSLIVIISILIGVSVGTRIPPDDQNEG